MNTYELTIHEKVVATHGDCEIVLTPDGSSQHECWRIVPTEDAP